MTEQTIKVYVVKVKKEKYLILRCKLPGSSSYTEKSSGTRVAREAERAAAKWEAELIAGKHKPKARKNWQELREDFERLHLPKLRASTRAKSFTVLNSFEDFAKPKHLSKITSTTVMLWQASLREKGYPETSIASMSGQLRMTLKWGGKYGYFIETPTVEAPSIDSSELMKGGPINVKQFAQFLRAVKLVVHDPDQAKRMRGLFRSMFWGSLRLSESINLSWDEGGLRVDLTGEFPVLRIAAKSDKGKKSRTLPIAPEFAQYLLSMKHRTGSVFGITTIRGNQPHASNLSKIIADIGRASKVQTSSEPVRYVTAHDLRRSFGTRWAKLVKPLVLMQMMRHSSISTTQKFYVSLDAEETVRMLHQVLKHPQK